MCNEVVFKFSIQNLEPWQISESYN